MGAIGGGGAGAGKIPDDPETGSLEEAEGRAVSAATLDGDGADEEPASEPEDRVEALLAEVAALRRELADAKTAAERAARRAAIERALTDAGAIDLEITTPLVERAMAETDAPDAAAAVRSVRDAKGFLFRRAVSASAKGSAMAGASVRGAGLEDLAGDARSSGDRGDLLRYLRARRG